MSSLSIFTRHDTRIYCTSILAKLKDDLIEFIVFNATSSNISAISWQPVLVMEESGVPGENQQPWATKLLINCITFGCESSTPFL